MNFISAATRSRLTELAITDFFTRLSGMKKLFTFPNPVNDAAARTVALGVVAMSALALSVNWSWLLTPLTYGFVARVATGPTLSPLGQFAVRIAAPRLRSWEKFVPGPPKRFAQAIGVVLCLITDVLTYTAGFGVARWVLVPLVLAASLEGFLGFCVGCTFFGWLIRAKLIPERICVECGDLRARYAAAGFDVTTTQSAASLRGPSLDS